jgi:biotin transport system substrate-specific component
VTKDTGAVISRIQEKNWRPFSVSGKWPYAISVPGFALLTWTLARIAVPLPGTPVPATLQTLSVLLAGLVLGPRMGVLSQGLYLLAGMIGLPVFALPGAGPAYFLGPTGGYLFGFVLAPWIVGRLLRWRIAAMVAGIAALHLCGTLWLLFSWSAGPREAIIMGSLPFLVFDLAKGVVALALAAHFPWTKRAD